MKVRDLIERLRDFDQEEDVTVAASCADDDYEGLYIIDVDYGEGQDVVIWAQE